MAALVPAAEVNHEVVHVRPTPCGSPREGEDEAVGGGQEGGDEPNTHRAASPWRANCE